MIDITPDLKLDPSEFSWQFVHSSGPGGQNVNKVATTAQLRWDVAGSRCLPPEVKERLARVAGRRMTRDGRLVIEAGRYRSQAQNREEAVERLVNLVRRAARPAKVRRPTTPSAAARRRRLDSKRRQAAKKRYRRADTGLDDG